MDATNRLRRAVATHPFLASEVALLGCVVVGSAGFVALVFAAAPVALLWVATLGTLAAGTLLPVAMLVHGGRDLWRLVAGDGEFTAGAVVSGLWRAGEVVLAAAFLSVAASATLVGEALAGADPSNPEAASTIGMALLFGLGLAAVLEVTLVAAVALRAVWSVAIRE